MDERARKLAEDNHNLIYGGGWTVQGGGKIPGGAHAFFHLCLSVYDECSETRNAQKSDEKTDSSGKNHIIRTGNHLCERRLQKGDGRYPGGNGYGSGSVEILCFRKRYEAVKKMGKGSDFSFAVRLYFTRGRG